MGNDSGERERLSEVNVRNQELKTIKESGTKWKSWGKEWIAKNRERHRYSNE